MRLTNNDNVQVMYELGSPPKSVLESMELVRLPSPPHILSKLLDLCHDPDTTASELAAFISIDTSLTSKLFMAVNSPAFAIEEPIADLEQAVTLIGPELVKTMALTTAIQQLFAGLIETQKQFVCNFWLDSLYCAVFARDLAIALNYEKPHDAYLAGLFHDFGQIVFDAKYHEQYHKIISENTEDETLARENSKWGISHPELGACVMEQWPSINPAIADAVRFHHEEQEQLEGCDLLCQIVAEAGQMARHWCAEGKIDTNWQSRLVTNKDLKDIYMHVKDKVTQVGKSLGISLPRARCLTHDHLSRDIEKETLRLARKIRDASLIRVINPEEIRRTAPDAPAELLLKISREMQLFFSISDMALLFHDPEDPEHLILHQVAHTGPASKFSLKNSKSQMIKSFLDKKELWIEPDLAEPKKSPIADRQIIRRLHHDIALSLPVMHEERSLGTVVIGCHKTQKNRLEKLSNIITNYLENLAHSWLHARQDASLGEVQEEQPEATGRNDIDKLIHEISNPLSVIGNYIDILKSNARETGESSQEIDVLKNELQRIRNIVLNFKEGEVAGEDTVFLNAELEGCVPLYVMSTSEDKEVQIIWQLDERDAELEIGQDAFRQILLNLVKNAVEAQDEDAAIIVSSHHFVNLAGNRYAQFSISDRGHGIDAKTLENLFSPGFTTKEGAGRGLGLSVVGEIIKAWNGQIKYMPNDVGGALFEVLIPLSIKQ